MNKLYLAAATFLSLSLSNAQSLTAVSSSQNILQNVKKPVSVLYEQVATGGSGIVSDVLSNGNFVMAADDFILSGDAGVKTFSFLGFQNAGTVTTLNRGLLMYIYADNAGKPAGIPGDANPYIAKIDLTEASTAFTITTPATGYFAYNIDVVEALGSALQLTANTKYWVAFAPKLNLTDYVSSQRWNWSVGAVNSEFAKLVDPTNAFGAGATNWTNINALTSDALFNGLAFSIEGDNNLGTTESYNTVRDIMVTQAADELYIFTKNEKLKSAVIYSADGRIVLKGSNDKMNIANLSKGIYIVNVTTTNGKTLSTKFIKK